MTVTRITAGPCVLRQHFAQLLVARAGDAQRAREGLEDGFDLVVVGAAVHGLDVDVGAGAAGEAFEEVGDQFGLQIADERRTDLGRRRR